MLRKSFADCEFISFAMFPTETNSPLDLRTRKRENVEASEIEESCSRRGSADNNSLWQLHQNPPASAFIANSSPFQENHSEVSEEQATTQSTETFSLSVLDVQHFVEISSTSLIKTEKNRGKFQARKRKREQPKCVRRLSFSDNEGSGHPPCKRIRLDEGAFKTKKGYTLFTHRNKRGHILEFDEVEPGIFRMTSE